MRNVREEAALGLPTVHEPLGEKGLSMSSISSLNSSAGLIYQMQQAARAKQGGKAAASGPSQQASPSQQARSAANDPNQDGDSDIGGSIDLLA